MHSQHSPMPVEEFRVMPWKLGWKYEYYNGDVHITPRGQIVTVKMHVEPRPVEDLVPFRSVERSDETALVDAFIAACHDTIEYCDWAPENIASTARKNIRNFLSGRRGTPLSVSRLAIEVHPDTGVKHLTGAALFTQECAGCPLLDILFVIPERQHQGLATALVSAAVNDLYGAGVTTLESRYMLGNEASQSWHKQFGFVEEPDLFLARLYYRHAQHELWRREKIGNPPETERQKLFSEEQYWKSQVEALEKIAEEQGLEVVLPILRSR